jgi:molybdopterin-guanine dinucleotide biosynthesis protein B
MTPVISFIGKSNSGKTTFLEKLIPELVKRGYKVGTIKHDTHNVLKIDREGKDSYRHKKAGAVTTILSSQDTLAVIRDVDEDIPIEELCIQYGDGVDIILAEGYKKGGHPKIEVTEEKSQAELFCHKDKKIIALISDNNYNVNLPVFRRDDTVGVANFIIQGYLKGGKVRYFSLEVNSNPVILKPFIENLLRGAIKGVISSLKGCEDPKRIKIRIEDS